MWFLLWLNYRGDLTVVKIIYCKITSNLRFIKHCSKATKTLIKHKNIRQKRVIINYLCLWYRKITVKTTIFQKSKKIQRPFSPRFAPQCAKAFTWLFSYYMVRYHRGYWTSLPAVPVALRAWGVFSNAIYRCVAFGVYYRCCLDGSAYADLRAFPSNAWKCGRCADVRSVSASARLTVLTKKFGEYWWQHQTLRTARFTALSQTIIRRNFEWKRRNFKELQLWCWLWYFCCAAV